MSEYTPKELRRQAEQWTPITYKELTELRRAHAAALETIRERDAEIARLNSNLDYPHKEIADMQAEIARLKTDRERLISANEHWHTRVEQLKAEVEAYRRDEEARDE